MAGHDKQLGPQQGSKQKNIELFYPISPTLKVIVTHDGHCRRPAHYQKGIEYGDAVDQKERAYLPWQTRLRKPDEGDEGSEHACQAKREGSRVTATDCTRQYDE